MRHLIAILAFAAGGLTAEVARPTYCSLITQSGISIRRREAERR